jgi:hypothetical protein
MGNQWTTFFFTAMWLPLYEMSWVMPKRVIDLFACWKAEECCELEDGANLHFFVCLEGNKS